jgi:hypothetical protein
MTKKVKLYTFFKWYKKLSFYVSQINHNISRRGIFALKKVVTKEWLLVSTVHICNCI